MEESKTDPLAPVADYYSDKLCRHGMTPRGVDWNGAESQALRFEQLCKVIDSPGSFSVNDLGCGYGALYDYLRVGNRDISYLGIDVAERMIEAARRSYGGRSDARFLVGAEPDRVADFGMASGIFNVRLDRSDEEWLSHIEATLDVMDRTSRRGFAFNCLTSYSDADMMQDYLFYADPCRTFDMCKHRFSRQVALLHDYGIYEFTIIVRKA